MPRGDRTGPTGNGSMTGRGMGYCSGSAAPGFMNPNPGRGFGRGMGRGGGGFGRRNMYYATGQPGWMRPGYYGPNWNAGAAVPDREQEIDMLKREADYLSQTLEEVNDRLEKLEKMKKVDK